MDEPNMVGGPLDGGHLAPPLIELSEAVFRKKDNNAQVVLHTYRWDGTVWRYLAASVVTPPDVKGV